MVDCRPRPEVVRLSGRVRVESYDVQTGALAAVLEHDNVICTVGKTALLHLLGGDGVVAVGIQYIAVGTGGGTPAASDVALSTELARQATTQVTVSGSQVTCQIFFTSSQANGTWTEIGAFGNGATGTAGSGTLFGHAALSYVKSSSLETVVAYSISIT
jgi:hypothetical protein